MPLLDLKRVAQARVALPTVSQLIERQHHDFDLTVWL